MASRTKKLENRIGFMAFSAFQRSFQKKPPEDAEQRGARLGMLLFRIDKKHRNRALSNLRIAYPELSESERLALAQRCFRHFGRIFADFLRSPLRTNEEVAETCPLIDFHHFDEALSRGKGAILVTGHFGNWERAAHAIAAAGYKMTVVARDANDGDLNQEVMRIRQKQGIEVLSRGAAARGILNKLKKNEIIGILTDQNSGDMFIPFFGKPCGTVTGPSAIHLKTGAPMIPMFCPYIGPGKYEARAYPPLEPVPGYEPLEGITRAMNIAIETAIRETPEQWLWFHNRWKSAQRAGLLD